MKLRIALVVLSLSLIPLVGCQREMPQQFVSSSEVLELPEELQQRIQEVLAEHIGTPDKPKLLGNEEIAKAHLDRGAELYGRFCVQCHGVTGDGNGPAAEYLNPLPRDYRRGIFKFTSTPFGSKPRRSDLIKTLVRGVPGTAMPSFARFSDKDLEAMVDYVLVLTHRGELESVLAYEAEDSEEIDPEIVPEIIDEILGEWEAAESLLVLPGTRMPEFTEETVAAGRTAFLEMGCYKCHGNDGRGGSMGNVEVGVDDWGNKAAAADLTSGMFRGGGRPLDIYRRIHSGINGSPMPAFGNALADSPDTVWHLVHFIRETGEQRRRGVAPTVTPVSMEEPVPSTEPADETTEDEASSPTEEPAPENEPAAESGEQPEAEAAEQPASAPAEEASAESTEQPASSPEPPTETPAAEETNGQ